MTRPEPGLLSLETPVTLAGRATRLVRLDGTAAKPIARIDGITSRTDIEAVRGEPLWVARADAPPLEADEYWADDLVGLAVTDGDREVGRVEKVVSMPSCELLVVDGDREVGRVDRVRSLPSCEVLEVGELLVPLVGDAVRDVDLAAGRVDVDLAFLGEA